MTSTELAKKAYETYLATLQKTNSRTLIISFDDLPIKIKAAWIAATEEIIRFLA